MRLTSAPGQKGETVPSCADRRVVLLEHSVLAAQALRPAGLYGRRHIDLQLFAGALCRRVPAR